MDDVFVPTGFAAPHTYAWSGLHLEPLGERHNDRDHLAWMSSIDHIRATPGFSEQENPGWPISMSLEANREDLIRHDIDFRKRRGFTYSILDGGDIIGCIYIYPDPSSNHDALITSWVRESYAEVDASVRQALCTWIDSAWPFENPHYAGAE